MRERHARFLREQDRREHEAIRALLAYLLKPDEAIFFAKWYGRRIVSDWTGSRTSYHVADESPLRSLRNLPCFAGRPVEKLEVEVTTLDELLPASFGRVPYDLSELRKVFHARRMTDYVAHR